MLLRNLSLNLSNSNNISEILNLVQGFVLEKAINNNSNCSNLMSFSRCFCIYSKIPRRRTAD